MGVWVYGHRTQTTLDYILCFGLEFRAYGILCQSYTKGPIGTYVVKSQVSIIVIATMVWRSISHIGT